MHVSQASVATGCAFRGPQRDQGRAAQPAKPPSNGLGGEACGAEPRGRGQLQFGYHDSKQLTSAKQVDTGNNVLQSLTYGYDSAGNRVQVGTERDVPSAQATGRRSERARPADRDREPPRPRDKRAAWTRREDESAAKSLRWSTGALGELGIPRLIPDSYGVTIERRLTKLVQDETTRLVREAVRARGKRSNAQRKR